MALNDARAAGQGPRGRARPPRLLAGRKQQVGSERVGPTRSRPVSWPPGLGLAGFQTVYGHGSGVPGPGQCMMAIARGT